MESHRFVWPHLIGIAEELFTIPSSARHEMCEHRGEFLNLGVRGDRIQHTLCEHFNQHTDIPLRVHMAGKKEVPGRETGKNRRCEIKFLAHGAYRSALPYP